MLYVFGFDDIAVVAGDVFFVDPQPEPGQEGAERGVRVELRGLRKLPLNGSIYSAQPVSVQIPLLRIDLFETFPQGRGSNDRVHYHRRFDGWEPGGRCFDPELSADPLRWVAKQFSDGTRLLGDQYERDVAMLADRCGEIIEVVERLWSRVRSGVFDPADEWAEKEACRLGWL